MPGESVRHFLGDSGPVLFRRDKREEGDRVSFPNMGEQERGQEKRETADEQTGSPETWREEVEMEPRSITRGNVDLDVFQHQCQPMSN